MDGVLGNDMLQDFTFTLNYSREEMVTGRLAELGDTGVPLKLTRSGDEFFIPVHLMSSPKNFYWIPARTQQICPGNLATTVASVDA